MRLDPEKDLATFFHVEAKKCCEIMVLQQLTLLIVKPFYRERDRCR